MACQWIANLATAGVTSCGGVDRERVGSVGSVGGAGIAGQLSAAVRRVQQAVEGGESVRLGGQVWSSLRPVEDWAMLSGSAALHCLCCIALPLLRCTSFAALHCLCCIALHLLPCTAFAALHCLCCIALPLLHCTSFAALHFLCCPALPLLRCTALHGTLSGRNAAECDGSWWEWQQGFSDSSVLRLFVHAQATVACLCGELGKEGQQRHVT